MSRLVRIFGFALPAVAIGCADRCGDCLLPATALVVGRVTNGAGAPVSGAAVLAYAVPPYDPCFVTSSPSGLGNTGANGQFRVDMTAGAAGDSACIFVRVRAPAGSGLRDTVVGPGHLSFRYQPPADSLILDITLAP